MENTSSSNFFNVLEQRERKGKVIFLVLAVIGSILTTVAVFTEFREVGLLPYLSYIFWDDDLMRNRLLLFNLIHLTAAILTPLLQIVLYVVAFLGKGWAIIALAVFNLCNFFVASLFVFSVLISSLGGKPYRILMLLTIAVYYFLSCLVLLRNKPVKDFISAQRR